MISTKSILIITSLAIVAACSSTKKSTTSTANSTPAPTTTAAPTNTAAYVNPKITGTMYTPGDKELAAIQPQYNDITMNILKEGYAIYYTGPCLNCHQPMDIYKIEESRCQKLITNMAHKANLTPAQSDAVLKFVLSIKATQAK